MYFEQRADGSKLYFFYDSYGNLTHMYHHVGNVKTAYNVVTNSQGDVIALYNFAGNQLVASYEYDAWGNCTITQDTTGIGALNPIRYRGYYYDSEIGLYYLQSRYYDPNTGRFINADGYITTGQGVLSYNMFAYCMNNPVMYSDPSGECGRFLGFLWKVDCKSPDCKTSKCYVEIELEPAYYFNNGKGRVYIITTDEQEKAFRKNKDKNAVAIYDRRNSSDPNIRLIGSYKIKSSKHKREIIKIMLLYNLAVPSDKKWNRTAQSLFEEWEFHNFAYYCFIERDRTADCDFNNADEGKDFMDYVGVSKYYD